MLKEQGPLLPDNLRDIDLSNATMLGEGESGSVWEVAINDARYALKILNRVDQNYNMELQAMKSLAADSAMKVLGEGEVVLSGTQYKAFLMPIFNKRLD